jgi:hypothetical protein
VANPALLRGLETKKREHGREWGGAISISSHQALELELRWVLLLGPDQLRDHTGKKRRYWLVLKEIIRAAPCFFLRVLAWY